MATTVVDLIRKYNEEKCDIELRNRTWCLCKNGKVVTRISSSSKAIEFLKEIEKIRS